MNRILLFAKAPVAGRVKTRLIPALGAEGAARLAGDMLQRTIEAALEARVGTVELCADPDPSDRAWTGHLHDGIALSAQGEGDLGTRLARAARRVLAAGERPLLIGADCPELDAARLREAAARLERADAVMVPTLDGGFALLGLRTWRVSYFSEISWSGPRVAGDVAARIHAEGLSLATMAPLRDIDEPEDLRAAGMHAG